MKTASEVLPHECKRVVHAIGSARFYCADVVEEPGDHLCPKHTAEAAELVALHKLKPRGPVEIARRPREYNNPDGANGRVWHDFQERTPDLVEIFEAQL